MGFHDTGGEMRVFEDGETIFMEGEEGNHLYIVLSGSVVIRKGGDLVTTTLGELGPGTMFGEQALVDGRPHSATAEAAGRTEVALYDKHTFLEALCDDPRLALRVIESLSGRLRATTETLQSLCEQYVRDRAEIALTERAILHGEIG